MAQLRQEDKGFGQGRVSTMYDQLGWNVDMWWWRLVGVWFYGHIHDLWTRRMDEARSCKTGKSLVSIKTWEWGTGLLKELQSILESVSIGLQLVLHLQRTRGMSSPWMETQKTTLKTPPPFTTQFKKYSVIMQIHAINPLLTQCGMDATSMKMPKRCDTNFFWEEWWVRRSHPVGSPRYVNHRPTGPSS